MQEESENGGRHAGDGIHRSMFNMEEALLDKASLYQLTVFILCLILAFFAVGFFVKPFRAIVKFRGTGWQRGAG